MGHTIYYKTSVSHWEGFVKLMRRVASALGYSLFEGKLFVELHPHRPGVEALRIEREGEGFVKTNLIEPEHSLYLLILYSISSFGSVSVWED
jgi:hypothetical protein